MDMNILYHISNSDLSELKAYTLGTATTLGFQTPFTVPSDGYLHTYLRQSSGDKLQFSIKNADDTNPISIELVSSSVAETRNLYSVKKGMVVTIDYVAGVAPSVDFIPLT